MGKLKRKTKRGRKLDRKKRSAEAWERGDGAPRKGNPRYKPVRRCGKDGVCRTVYIVRKEKKKR